MIYKCEVCGAVFSASTRKKGCARCGSAAHKLTKLNYAQVEQIVLNAQNGDLGDILDHPEEILNTAKNLN